MNYTTAELLAGIGSWKLGFGEVAKRHGDTHEILFYAEWDKYASCAYSAIHYVSEDLNIWDVSEGYMHKELGLYKFWVVNTCMLGKTYEYQRICKLGTRKITVYDNRYLFKTKEEAVNLVKKIRSEHPKFKIDEMGQFILPKVDVLGYSPPCQPFSMAGQRKGTTVDKGNLFYGCTEIIKRTQPKFAFMENVKGLVSGSMKKDFNSMLWHLNSMNYNNNWDILNSKDFKVPQNRERVFVTSIRKDLHGEGFRYETPQPYKLELRLKDVLEEVVHPKYHLSKKLVESLIRHSGKHAEKGNGFRFEPTEGNGVGKTITTSINKCRTTDNYIKVNQIGNISNSESFNGNPQTGRIYSVDGLSPTLSTMQGGSQEPKVLVGPENSIKVNSAVKGGYEEAVPGDSITLDQPKSTTRRGRVGKEVSQTLTTSCNIGVYNGYSIRKLTPIECWRLQDIPDNAYCRAVIAHVWKFGKKKNAHEWLKYLEKENAHIDIWNLKGFKQFVHNSNTDTQMYIRAGNTITRTVPMELYENVIYKRKQEGQQISLF